MVWNPDLFEEVGKLAGFEYRSKGTNERFTRDQLDEIAERLGIDSGDFHCGRLREKIGEEAGFDFEQGYSTNPRDFSTEEVKSIIQCLESKVTVQQ